MTYFREQLQKAGASSAVMSSNALKYLEKFIAEDAGFCDKEALSQLERIADCFEQAESERKKIELGLKDTINRVEAVKLDINSQINDYVIFKKKNIGEIEDKQIAESVKAYKAILEATKDVFGEKCTESVITSAIEAASYTAWRGIMGPKWTDDQNQTRKRL